tara:strand:+ start:77 stop:1009 length:933 start_codon:yes stop_codon:yes gene_type:complete
MNEGDAREIYRRHRPEAFDQIVGQEAAIETLKRSGKLPSSLLFSGPSGCGKTTIVRILKNELGCSDVDFVEMNAANDRGIETIREVQYNCHAMPLDGDCRIYLLDEAHQLTFPAQEALLKILEDTPAHVYFMLCTTNPAKLKKAIHTRCMHIQLKALSDAEVKEVLKEACKLENIKLTREVGLSIVEAAEGSARQALVLLQTVQGIENEDLQLEAIAQGNAPDEVKKLCQLLLKRAEWSSIISVLRQITGEPEYTRQMICGYMAAVLMKKPDVQAYRVIDSFSDPFYVSGKAKLLAACYESIYLEEPNDF